MSIHSINIDYDALAKQVILCEAEFAKLKAMLEAAMICSRSERMQSNLDCCGIPHDGLCGKSSK